MHKYLVYGAYGWLVLSGVLHYLADVVSPYLREQRESSTATTLYYGLHSAFSLGQVAFGALGLFLARRAADHLDEAPLVALSLLAGFGWLAITFLFMEYWEPKVNVALFCMLVLAAAFTR
jgi:hypothetical protein